MKTKEEVVENKHLSSQTNFDSLPASERVRMSWDEYDRLVREHAPCDSGTRSKIDACVLQYARAAADVAREDQADSLAEEVATLDGEPGAGWEEYLSLANVPETCDFVAGPAGQTTKDVTNRGRCGRPAEWRRGTVLACDVCAVMDMIARVKKLREAVEKIYHSRKGGGE